MEYKDYIIEYNPKPIPRSGFNWDWYHKNYDGPGSDLCGTASSIKDAMAQIDELEEQ